MAAFSPLHAQESHHPGKEGMNMSMPMKGDQMMMQGHMEKMRDVMDSIHKTNDPVERCKLMQEHMQDSMAAMHGKEGGMKEMPAMEHGNNMSGDCTTAAQQEKMNRHIEMMDQMMQHQEAAGSQHEHQQ